MYILMLVTKGIFVPFLALIPLFYFIITQIYFTHYQLVFITVVFVVVIKLCPIPWSLKLWQFLNWAVNSPSHSLQPGGPRLFPLDELPSLRLKSLIFSVLFCVRVPSHSQRAPVVRCWILSLTVHSQVQSLHCPGVKTRTWVEDFLVDLSLPGGIFQGVVV